MFIIYLVLKSLLESINLPTRAAPFRVLLASSHCPWLIWFFNPWGFSQCAIHIAHEGSLTPLFHPYPNKSRRFTFLRYCLSPSVTTKRLPVRKHGALCCPDFPLTFASDELNCRSKFTIHFYDYTFFVVHPLSDFKDCIFFICTHGHDLPLIEVIAHIPKCIAWPVAYSGPQEAHMPRLAMGSFRYRTKTYSKKMGLNIFLISIVLLFFCISRWRK